MDNIKESIRVLIVDDSHFRREAFTTVLNLDPEIEVIDTASNGKEALQKTKEFRPDVITMDIQMPIMNGFDAIDQIMKCCPCPIIVTSGIDVAVVVKALSMGAMDFVAINQDLDAVAHELIEKIKIAATVNAIRRIELKPQKNKPKYQLTQDLKIVVIGVSTGGPAALTQLFSHIPEDMHCGFLVIQHISKGFVQGLVEHLTNETGFDCNVAKPGDIIQKNKILFAPDGSHLKISYNNSIKLVTEPSSIYMPSIDITMESVAQAFHKNAIGIILTGMGSDGTQGITAIKNAGGITIAQSESSSVVYGMNKMAIQSGSIDHVAELNAIPTLLKELCRKPKTHAQTVKC